MVSSGVWSVNGKLGKLAWQENLRWWSCAEGIERERGGSFYSGLAYPDFRAASLCPEQTPGGGLQLCLMTTRTDPLS